MFSRAFEGIIVPVAVGHFRESQQCVLTNAHSVNLVLKTPERQAAPYRIDSDMMGHTVGISLAAATSRIFMAGVPRMWRHLLCTDSMILCCAGD